ncbi:unnamed protein product [Rotaria sp. Silwood2]|nr:unnamed protein product [Rotaria sp. Silwood2]
MDLIKHFGQSKQTNNLLTNGLIIAGNTAIGESPVGRYFRHTPRTHHQRKLSKQDNSSTISSGGYKANPILSTFHAAANVAAGKSQQMIHQSSTNSSFKNNSLKIELLTNRSTSTVSKFYPTFTIK